MNDVLIAFITALPPTILALATLIVSLRNEKQNIESSDKANKKLNTIHDLTNSSFTKATEKIDRLELIIKGQNKTIAKEGKK